MAIKRQWYKWIN